MRKSTLAISLVALVIIGTLAVKDSRIKAENARRQEGQQMILALEGQYIERSLDELLKNASPNATSLASVRTLQSEFAKAKSAQTSVAMRVFKTALAKSKPLIIHSLAKPDRSKADHQLLALTADVNQYANSIITKENTEKSAARDVFTKFMRDLGLAETP